VYANSNTYDNRDANSNTYGNSDGDAYTDSYAYSYTYTTPVQITLHAHGYKVHGLQNGRPLLEWADLGYIDIYRNGALIATVPNDGGAYTDHINRTGKGTIRIRCA